MTKAEILKTHKMTEQEFYKKFPTQEAYNQFQMGGSLSPKQKFEMGGLTPLVATYPTPNLPATGTSTPAAAAAPGTAAPGNGFKLSGLGGGQQAPQQAGSDPNAPTQKNMGKTIGTVVGGVAGSVIAPGVGTMVGGALGGAIGGAVDTKTYENKMEDYSAIKSSQQNAMNSNIAGNFNPNAQGKTFKMGGNLIKRADGSYSQRGLWDNIRANKGSGKQPTKEMLAQEKKINSEYKMGGNFTEYHGNTHENGGIPIGQSEVEGGETNNNGYIYSDTLKLGKKTFADMSKKINNKYSRRPDDKISMESKERELGNLAKIQESTGLTNNSRGMFFNGGFGIEDDNVTGETGTYGNQVYGTPFSRFAETPQAPNVTTYNTDNKLPDVVPTDQSNVPTDKNNNPLNVKQIDLKTSPYQTPSSTTPPPPDTNKPLQTKVNPLGYLASAIGPAYNVAQGLKGGDPVNFERMNTKYQYADPRGAMSAANKGITSAYNSAKNAARNTTTSAGEYLANMGNLTSKEGMERAATMAGIKGQYDMANTQGLNQTNLTKDQYNAQVQMRESEARQQEQDAARSSISQGLNNFGQNTLGYSQDIAMNKSQNMMTPFMADRFDLVEDAEGNISFKRKAIKKSDSKKDITTPPDKQ